MGILSSYGQEKVFKLTKRITLNSNDISSSPDFGYSDVGYWRTNLLGIPSDYESNDINKSDYLGVLGGYRSPSSEQNLLFNDFGTIYKPILSDIDIDYYLDKGIIILRKNNLITVTEFNELKKLARNDTLSNKVKFYKLVDDYYDILGKLKETKYEIKRDTFTNAENVKRAFEVEINFDVDSILKKVKGIEISANAAMNIKKEISKAITINGLYILAHLRVEYTNKIENKINNVFASSLNSNNDFENNLLTYDKLPADSKYGINTGLSALSMSVSYDKTKIDTLKIDTEIKAILGNDAIKIAEAKALLDIHFSKYKDASSTARFNRVFILRLGTKKSTDNIRLNKP